MSKSDLGKSESQLILAQEDAGVIRLARVDLIPIFHDGDPVHYETHNYPTKSATDGLVFVTAGIDDVAFDVLYQVNADIKGDPVIDRYREQMAKNKGSELAFIDLEDISKDIVRRTAGKHMNEVGLPLQMATIEDGRVFFVTQPFLDSKPYQPPARMSNFTIVNDFGSSAFGGKGFFLFRVGLRGGLNMLPQRLDGNYVFESEFTRCKLLFGGDTESIFDSSNKMTDSELVVSSEAQMQSAFVTRFRHDFPQVKVSVDPGEFPH